MEPMLHVDRYVTAHMPRTFLWHNTDDEMVPVENSLRFLEALKKKGISFEAHIFPRGGHMLSLCGESTATDEQGINYTCAQWFGLALDWMRRNENI